MQQIAEWLEKLGISEYAHRFAENGVDVSVLPHLTDQDLKDIGVLLGHRRKMLAAIANLGNAAAVAMSPPASLSAPPVEAVTTTPVGERRHVTVDHSCCLAFVGANDCWTRAGSVAVVAASGGRSNGCRQGTKRTSLPSKPDCEHPS